MPGAERLPPLDPDLLTADQVAVRDRVAAGPRGAVLGPFEVLLRTPRLMDRVQAVGAHLRYDATLRPALFELVVLMVARHWDQAFEWAHHQPLALARGLAPEVVQAVGEDRRPPRDEVDVDAVWSLVEELLRTRTVADATYAETRNRIGEPALVEVLVAAGYYTTLAMVLNVAGTPAEPGPGLPARPSGGPA